MAHLIKSISIAPNCIMAQQKRIAIVQSCYIPWKGYFDLIGKVDEFVIYDDVQFVKRHWHNRNKIKTPQKNLWLSVPVDTKGKFHQSIFETKIAEPWAEKHWRTIEQNYKNAPHFDAYQIPLKELYEQAEAYEYLSEVNQLFLREICRFLDIDTKITFSSAYPSTGIKTERLLSICMAAGATDYLSGPAARVYFEEDLFNKNNIGVEWMDYAEYPEYCQLNPPFDHGVSILDLMFNCGPKSNEYMKFTKS